MNTLIAKIQEHCNKQNCQVANGLIKQLKNLEEYYGIKTEKQLYEMQKSMSSNTWAYGDNLSTEEKFRLLSASCSNLSFWECCTHETHLFAKWHYNKFLLACEYNDFNLAVHYAAVILILYGWHHLLPAYHLYNQIINGDTWENLEKWPSVIYEPQEDDNV